MKYNAILVLAFLPAVQAQPDRFSIPACDGPGQELAVREFFLVCHSASLKTAVWTGYELKSDQLHGEARRPSHFCQDRELAGTGAYDSDYRLCGAPHKRYYAVPIVMQSWRRTSAFSSVNSGFSRGHLVPAADAAWSPIAMRATFLLSNAVPQKLSVNVGRWRQLEDSVREIAASSDAVYVFTGVLFEDGKIEFIGGGLVAVPSYTFKVVLAVRGEQKTMYAAILPNTVGVRDSLDHFAVTVEEVQQRTGLDFLSGLEDGDELRLESERHVFPRPGRANGCEVKGEPVEIEARRPQGFQDRRGRLSYVIP